VKVMTESAEMVRTGSATYRPSAKEAQPCPKPCGSLRVSKFLGTWNVEITGYHSGSYSRQRTRDDRDGNGRIQAMTPNRWSQGSIFSEAASAGRAIWSSGGGQASSLLMDGVVRTR
jgi:hypothetical protein